MPIVRGILAAEVRLPVILHRRHSVGGQTNDHEDQACNNSSHQRYLLTGAFSCEDPALLKHAVRQTRN
jgi:hypothetical protein